MPFNQKTNIIIAGIIFIVLLSIGFLLSEHKLLWLDECYTQHVSIDKPSYKDILTMNFFDGNRCPLFYLFQKINCDIFSFHYLGTSPIGSYDATDLRSQIIIRIPSNIYMSLALAAIFYFFARFFSLFTGLYALAVALVTPMVWMYWVEARPYSLWILLTTLQLLFFSATVLSPKLKLNKYIYISHILLILTTPGSIFQIAIISLMLFLRSGYKKRQLLCSFLLPLCFFIFYYFYVPVYRFKSFYFLESLYEVVMPERLCVYVLYALAAWVLSRMRKESSMNTFFLPVFLLFFISVCFILIVNLFNDKYFFDFHYRYLIYIVPADIIMFSLACRDLWQWSKKNFWVASNLVIFIGGLMIIRALITYREVLATALYLHTPG